MDAAADAATSRPRPIRRRAASGDRTTAARPGSSCRTRATAGCTTARSASTRRNPQIAYQGGAPFFKTIDGGKTWRTVGGIPHSDHHAIWINPQQQQSHPARQRRRPRRAVRPGRNVGVHQHDAARPVLRGSAPTCGSRTTSAAGCRTTAAGAVRARTRSGTGILNSDWFRVGGGDGFYTQNDPTDWTIDLFGIAGRQHQPPAICGPVESRQIRPRPARRPRSRAGGGRPEAAKPARLRSRQRRRAVLGGRRWTERRARATARHELPLLLEHAVHPVAAQSAHGLSRRRSLCSGRTTAATPGRHRRT